jgi:hypothetical protein
MLRRSSIGLLAVLACGQIVSAQSSARVAFSDQPTAPMLATPAGAQDPTAAYFTTPDGHGASNRFWARGEYLLWRVESTRLPPLLTVSAPGTPLATAGVLGTPGTVVLFGDERVNDEWRSGMRFELGAWLDCDQTVGIQGSFFMLGSRGTGIVAGSSDGSQIIGRPFFDASGKADVELISFPGLLAGTASVDAHTGNVWGADIVLRKNLCCGCNYRLDFQLGYRFLSFDDAVRINENLQPLSAVFVPGTRVVVDDSFAAENQFHGAVLGLAYERRRGPWSLEAVARIDLGATRREVAIEGSTAVSVPGTVPVVNTGGLLAQFTNIGVHRSSDFAVVPELELNLGYNITQNVRVYAGYSFLCWTRVGRAGDQIDTVVNPNTLPPPILPLVGPARPAFPDDTSNLFLHGLSFGLELRF